MWALELTQDRTIMHNAAVMVIDSSALPDTGCTFTKTAHTPGLFSHHSSMQSHHRPLAFKPPCRLQASLTTSCA